MIVLDEQLLGRNIEQKIARWYRGKVCFIIDLRPDTVIKDDAIPDILRQHSHPTFITINEKDFWRKISINKHCCIICFTLPDSRAQELPHLVRKILRIPLFCTKSMRMGKVIRVSRQEIAYYTWRDKRVKVIRRLSR